MKILPVEVESEGCDWGVAFAPDENDPNGVTILCEDEPSARETARMTGGKVVVREVFSSAWAELGG
jgi:hypothetical protein